MPGDGEEHVIEVRRVDGELLDLDIGIVELSQQPPQRPDATIAGHLEEELLVVAGAGLEQVRGRAQRLWGGELELDVAARDAPLEFAGAALSDDPAPIENRDPVRELVRLIEVLGG